MLLEVEEIILFIRRYFNFVTPIPDCMLSAWSEWSECSADCDSGEQERTRTVEIPASGGGKPCDGDLKEVRGTKIKI